MSPGKIRASRFLVPARLKSSVLLVAAVVSVPALILLASASISWVHISRDARTELKHTAEAVKEFTARAFDGTSLLADRVDDLLRDSTDEDISNHEEEFHGAMKRIILTRPDVLTLYAIASDGRPLVSANIYPVPANSSLYDRDFFQALRDGTKRTYISDVHVSRFDGELFFSIAHRRGSAEASGNAGEMFNGIVLASLRPNRMGDSLRRFAPDREDIVSIIRGDGATLASTQHMNTPPRYRVPLGSLTLALEQDIERARETSTSVLSNHENLIAYSQVEDFPVYAVVQRPTSAIVHHWLSVVAWQAALTLPASLGLVVIALYALRRSREVAEARALVQIAKKESEVSEALRQQEAACQTRLSELQLQLLHAARVSTAGAMASALAHEINQPLTAVTSSLGAVEQILAGKLTLSQQRLLLATVARAAAQAVQAGKIIQTLRRFLRHKEPEVRPVQVQTLLDDAIALAFIGLSPNSIALDVAIEDNLPPTRVDSVQIQQVIINLLRNALEAMMSDEGSDRTAERRIRLSARTMSPDTVEVSVADNGPGLTKSMPCEPTLPFISSKPNGMGVGLSICRRIIEAHGGRFWMEVNSPRGAIFKFTLPAVTQEDLFKPTTTSGLTA